MNNICITKNPWAYIDSKDKGCLELQQNLIQKTQIFHLDTGNALPLDPPNLIFSTFTKDIRRSILSQELKLTLFYDNGQSHLRKLLEL